MSFETLLKERKLRVRLRGYDRRSTDDLLRAVEEALATLAAERDQLRRRLIEVEQEVNRFREEAHVAEEKLLAAQMAEADAVSACELLEVEAQRRAERLVAEAEARAAQIVAASKHESRPARPIVEELQKSLTSLEFGDIANEELRRDHLPSRSDDQLAWISFALTFDAYEAKGGFDKCAAFAEKTRARWESSGALPSNLSDLRAALFFEQRRWRWSAEELFTEDEWRYWSAIGDAIRELLPV